MKKWLVIQFKQIGDVILTTHLPREIKRLYPDAEVDFLTFDINRSLLINNPNIKRVYTVSPKNGIFSTLKSVLTIRKNRYDVILDTQNTPRSMYYILFGGAKVTVGFEKSKRKKAYAELVKAEGSYAGIRKLNMLKPFDADFSYDKYDCRAEVFFTPQDITSAFLKVTGIGIDMEQPYITMSPTHKKNTRRWKMRHFLDTANWLAEEKGFQVLLTYGPGEKDYITEGMKEYSGEINQKIIIAPPLTMPEFAAILSQAKMHIGNDSAPHHLAVSQKTPTFVVIGSSPKSWVHPDEMHTYRNLGMECQPCGKDTCAISDDIPCLNDLTFEMIKPDLEDFIQKNI
jgi:heptosyltransferase-2/heptosyltransferase-3